MDRAKSRAYWFEKQGLGDAMNGSTPAQVLEKSGWARSVALGEALDWPCSLERAPKHAKGFYVILSVAILIGLGLNFAHINTIKALFWTAVINGVAAGPIMVMTMLMGSNPIVMGEVTLKKRPRILGWAATVVMILASIAMFALWGN